MSICVDDVLRFFPYPTPRSEQVDCIRWVVDRLNSGEDFLILDARTGFGKSGVARCLTDYFSSEGLDNFIFTNNKSLQEQYLRDSRVFNPFNVSYELGKGRGNFVCRQSKLHLETVKLDDDYDFKFDFDGFKYGESFPARYWRSCNDGDCTVIKNYSCPYYRLVDSVRFRSRGCDYVRMKSDVRSSSVALLNYDVKLSDNVFTGGKNYDERYLCVYDEAHNIEEKIVNYATLSLPLQSMEKDVGFVFKEEYWNYNCVSDWLPLLDVLLTDYDRVIGNVKRGIEGSFGERKDEYRHILKRLKTRCDGIRRVRDYILEDVGNWVVVLDKFNGKVDFKPLRVDDFTYDFLFKSGDKHIFMSGSVLDAEQFCKDLGIPYNESNVYTSDGVFDFKKNSPLYMCCVGNMRKMDVEVTKPKTLPVLKRIFYKHKGDKGLIHCKSRALAKYILDSINDNRLVSYGLNGFPSKEKALENFINSDKDLIMVSYSMEEGVDLPYDACRFQVFYKAPYLFLGDTRVNELRKRDYDWYMVNTVRVFQQMYGRGMRAVDDYCSNYVLDSGFNGLFNHKCFPSYIREAIRWE